MKDQMLIDKYNELGKAHVETVNQLAKKDELIKERDELIKSGINYMTEAHSIFTPNVTNSLALDWIEKAKKLVGEK